MARLRISIVTPSFNQGRFIERTIRSVLDQRGDFDLEYRVVDAGSTDETVSILRSFGDLLVWASEPDNGQADAINKGLRWCSGDIVGWLNSDDVLLPGALDKVALAFRNHQDVEWVHGRCEIINTDDQPIRRWISAYKHFRAKRHRFENLLTENYVSQMTAFWRRSAHDAIGYLDASLNWTFDYDFWLRLAARGDPIYIPDRIACFRWHKNSKSGAEFEGQFLEDAKVALRHARGMRSALWRKQAKNAAILSVYRLLAARRAMGAAPPR